MKFSKILLATGVSQILAGCSGHIYVMDRDQAIQNFGSEKDKKRYVGIPFSPLRERIQTYYLDRILDKDGKVIRIYTGTSEDSKDTACNLVEVKEAQIAPDVDPLKTRYIAYDPGWLETSTFGVELDNGVITKVNSSSTPGVKVAADALSTIVSAVRLATKGESLTDATDYASCTAGRLIRPADKP